MRPPIRVVAPLLASCLLALPTVAGALEPTEGASAARPRPADNNRPAVVDRLGAEIDPFVHEALLAQPATEVLVHGTDLGAVEAAVDAVGVPVLGTFDFIETIVVRADRAQVAALAEADGITYLEGNRPLDFDLDTAIEATRVAEARHAPALAAPSGLPYTGEGIGVAVVDSGVVAAHPFFQRPDGTSQVRRNLRSCNFVFCTEVDLPDSDTAGAGGHGTHVAGIVGGRRTTTADGTPISGVAPEVDLYGLGQGVGLNIVDATSALQWVHRNHLDPCARRPVDDGGDCHPIRVVNESFGSNGELNEQDSVVLANRALVDDGLVVVIANGNDGGDGSTNQSGSQAQDQTPGIISVANYDDAGTGTRDGRLSTSSSRGDESRPETWPDVSAPGSLITSSCTYTLPICRAYGDVTDPWYAAISGTSMAAPHVAGLVAVLLEADPSLTPAEVETLLEDTAHAFGDPDGYVGGTSFDKGHGLVDAVAALSEILDVEDPSPVGSCAPGQVSLALDDTGDATQAAAVDAGVAQLADPALDLVSVTARSLADARAAEVTIEVVALSDEPPVGSHGEYYRVALDLSGRTHDLRVEWDRTDAGPTARLIGPSGATVASDLPLTWDTSGSTITVTLTDGAHDDGVPAAEALAIVPGSSLRVEGALSQRLVGVLTLTADEVGAGCPATFHHGTAGRPFGGAPADVELAAVGATAAIDGGSLLAVSPTGCADDAADCTTFAVDVLAPGTLVVEVSPGPSLVMNDVDVSVADAAGRTLGRSASGGTERVEVSVEPGRYVVVVETWIVVDGDFEGTVSLI